MSHYAQDERRALADLLEETGPHAPTMCVGWTTSDLAAHLIVRERRPDAAVGILVPLAAGYTERVQRSVRDDRSWASLVEQVRQGPPMPLRPVDELMNTVEFFVHHEDVLRATPGWAGPRELPAGERDALWGRLKMMSRVLVRRAADGVVFHAPGYGTVRAKGGATAVTVSGTPDELLLFAFGRSEKADVKFTGDDAAITRLRSSSLGL